MLIPLDLNINDCEALLRHCQSFCPESGGAREDRRLADVLEELAEQVQRCLGSPSLS